MCGTQLYVALVGQGSLQFLSWVQINQLGSVGSRLRDTGSKLKA